MWSSWCVKCFFSWLQWEHRSCTLYIRVYLFHLMLIASWRLIAGSAFHQAWRLFHVISFEVIHFLLTMLMPSLWPYQLHRGWLTILYEHYTSWIAYLRLCLINSRCSPAFIILCWSENLASSLARAWVTNLCSLLITSVMLEQYTVRQWHDRFRLRGLER